MRYKIFTAVILLFIFTAEIFAQRVVRKGMKQDGKEMGGKHTVQTQSAPAKYNTGQLNGKWQETKRTGRTSGESFTDTLLISVKNGRGETRTAGSMTMSMKGPVSVDAPDVLIIAGDSYIIKSLKEDYLQLEDANFLRTLKKVDHFYSETVGKDSIKEPVYNNPVNANVKDLSGKWIIYRRQAPPGFINENTILIKSLSFLQQTDDSNASGMIVIYNGTNISEELTCTFAFANGQVTVTTPKSAMTFTVYKADANEFVFGKEGELVNHAKH